MERLMHYIWEHRLYPSSALTTVDGRQLTVLDPGLHNNDAGPDFFNAKILIDRQEWVGNVEIHVRASDWMRHGHDNDAAYDSVILHVVQRDDAAVRRPDGQVIPQLRLDCVPDFSVCYDKLVSAAAGVEMPPCASQIASMNPLALKSWLDSLAYERLHQKSDRLLNLVQQSHGDWESACYVVVARALGFGTNSLPMERLALSLPLAAIRKHSDSVTAIEAMLFGQSGLLDAAPDDDRYVQLLRREYAHLANKFSLTRPQSLGWKMTRMRPSNMPHRRIALLAAMLLGGFKFMAQITRVESAEEGRKLFAAELSDYWHTHYTFTSAPLAAPMSLMLTQTATDGLVINVVAPVLWAYGHSLGREDICDRAIALLGAVRAENNNIVRAFAGCGIECPDALTSQALIQLRREYCDKRNCLRCRIGHAYLSQRAVNQPSATLS